jgi:hypothetical protein
MSPTVDEVPLNEPAVELRSMHPDATPEDWIRFEKECGSQGISAALKEWMSARSPGKSFGRFDNTPEQVLFVVDHVRGTSR